MTPRQGVRMVTAGESWVGRARVRQFPGYILMVGTTHDAVVGKSSLTSIM